MRDGLRWALVLALVATQAVAISGQEGQQPKREEVRIETKKLPFTTKYIFSRSVGAGRLVKAQEGKPGAIRKHYRITKGGRSLVKTEQIDPVPEVFAMGKAGYKTSRGSFVRGKVMTLTATAYDPSAGRGSRATFRTATGARAQYGCIAVDPRVIPLGTHLYVEGYGFGIANDKGSAIKGNKIDLCVNTRAEAMRFGRRKVKVHILKTR